MIRPRTEAELASWLAAKLRLPMVPDGIWQELSDLSYVRNALGSSRGGLSELLGAARSYVRAASGPVTPSPLGRQKKRARSASLVPAAEIRRAEVFSLFLAKLATRDRAVLRFRREVLGDRSLSQLEAQSLLISPAPYLLTSKELASWKIPAQEHQAEVEHRREGLGGANWREHVVLRLRAAKRSRTYKFVIRRSRGDGMLLDVPPALWGRATPLRGVEPFVRPLSAFDLLRKVCNWLSERFPWRPWDAVWFVLTGIPPFVPPIQPQVRAWTSQTDKVPIFRRDLLTLEMDPWLSVAAVVRVYRAYQRQILAGRNRGLGARSMDLFLFVTEREGTNGRTKTWDELRAEWNREHRDCRYLDYKNFRRDFDRARRAVLLPKYRPVGAIPLW